MADATTKEEIEKEMTRLQTEFEKAKTSNQTGTNKVVENTLE